MTRLLLVGAGALGCVFAGFFAGAGHSVRLLDNDAKKAEILSRHGLRCCLGKEEKRFFLPCTTTVEAEADLIFFCVKSFQMAEAAELAAPALGKESFAVSWANGLGNAEALAARLPQAQLGIATTRMAGRFLPPNLDVCTGLGLSEIAPYRPEAMARAEALAELMRELGLPAEAAADWQPAVWRKLLCNAVINPLTALARIPNGELPGLPEAESRGRAVLREALAIAAAKGISGLPTEDELWEETLRICRMTAQNHGSMLADMEAGRQTEILSVNGALAAYGRELGIPAPANTALTEAVLAASSGSKEGTAA